MLGVRCLAMGSLCCKYDAEACLLRPGNLEGGGWSRGASCSGSAAMGSRGSREKALLCVVGLGSLGWAFGVGRNEVGLGLGRVFAAVGVDVDGFGLVMGGGRLVKFPMPKVGPVLRRSREAEGRSKRVGLASPPRPPDKLSLDADGRRAGVGRGVGRRDIGRGRALCLLLSSMVRWVVLLVLSSSGDDWEGTWDGRLLVGM